VGFRRKADDGDASRVRQERAEGGFVGVTEQT
jgi:hypothetical protein